MTPFSRQNLLTQIAILRAEAEVIRKSAGDETVRNRVDLAIQHLHDGVALLNEDPVNLQPANAAQIALAVAKARSIVQDLAVLLKTDGRGTRWTESA